MKNKKTSHPAPSLPEKFQNFAVNHISGFSDLNELTQFPANLWEQMIKDNLFGVALDKEFGGQGQTIDSISTAGMALVEFSGNLGVAMSWMIHEVVASWILSSFGSEAQNKSYLPQLASGEKTACLAVSEPKTGAHPKFIRTNAKTIPAGYLLNGEKTYLTNGPIADFFIVIAVTGQASGKNQFTAFIVPKDSPGLTVTDPVDFPFLRPSPHGGILLKDCMIKPEQVLGGTGDAYDRIVLPFRTIEDTMMMGPITGGLKFLLGHFIEQLKQQSISPDASLIEEIGHLKCAIDAMEEISGVAAKELEKNIGSERLLSLGLFFKTQATGLLKTIEQTIKKTGIEPDQKTTYMISDLNALTRIGKNVSKIKLAKLGKSFF